MTDRRRSGRPPAALRGPTHQTSLDGQPVPASAVRGLIKTWYTRALQRGWQIENIESEKVLSVDDDYPGWATKVEIGLLLTQFLKDMDPPGTVSCRSFSKNFCTVVPGSFKKRRKMPGDYANSTIVHFAQFANCTFP